MPLLPSQVACRASRREPVACSAKSTAERRRCAPAVIRSVGARDGQRGDRSRRSRRARARRPPRAPPRARRPPSRTRRAPGRSASSCGRSVIVRGANDSSSPAAGAAPHARKTLPNALACSGTPRGRPSRPCRARGGSRSRRSSRRRAAPATARLTVSPHAPPGAAAPARRGRPGRRRRRRAGRTAAAPGRAAGRRGRRRAAAGRRAPARRSAAPSVLFGRPVRVRQLADGERLVRFHDAHQQLGGAIDRLGSGLSDINAISLFHTIIV